MPKIVWSNFLGLAPGGYNSQVSDVALRVGGEGTFASAAQVNPLVRPGYLSPGWGFTESTNADTDVDARIQRFQIEDDSTTASSYAYGLEAGAKIHQIELVNYEVSNTGAWPHTIDHAHTSETGEDCLMVNMGGTRYLLYSFNDATDGDIGRHELGTTTFDDSWFSGIAAGNQTLTLGVPHPLVEGDNGFGYVGDDNSIHKLDLQNNTVTLSAIDLPLDWVIQEFAKYRGFLFIVANKKTNSVLTSFRIKREVAVFVWNYISLQAGNETGFSDIIPIGDVSLARHIFVHEGNLYLTTEDQMQSKIKVYNGSTFDTIASQRIGTITPSLSPGSIENYLGNIMFGTKEGYITTYGSVPGSDGPILNHIALKSSSAIGAIVATALSDTYLFSIGTSIYRNSGFSTGIPVFKTLFQDLPYMSHLIRANILFTPFSSADGNSRLDVTIQKNSGLSTALPATKQNIITAEVGARGWITFPIGEPNVHSVAARLQWRLSSSDAAASRAPRIYRIEVEYESKSKKL